MANWVKIDDSKVLHNWECPECNERAIVHPWFYSEMGEPCCEGCDCDMEYIYTETLVDG